MNIAYRWLGAAGLEFVLDDFVLLVDPFFTRPGKLKVILGARQASDEALTARWTPRANAVLVTHPHYDHLLDVPGILRRTGARAYGSPNTCRLLSWQQVPAGQTACVHTGDRLTLGPFTVEVLPARHTPIPQARRLNGPLAPEGGARLPLRLNDYRMDYNYSYRITGQGQSWLVGSHPAPAQTLFIAPYYGADFLTEVVRGVQPRLVVPIHWDDFMRPLDRPLKPMLVPRSPGQRPLWAPVRRVNLNAFTQAVIRACPTAEVRIPGLLETAWLAEG